MSLFASSGYLISKAALTPPIYTLTVFIACIKLLGFISAGSRYGERYFSHRTTFNILSRLRVSFLKSWSHWCPRFFLNIGAEISSPELSAMWKRCKTSFCVFFIRRSYPLSYFYGPFFHFVLFLLYCLGVMYRFDFHHCPNSGLLCFQTKKSRASCSAKPREFIDRSDGVFYGFRDLKIYQQLEHKQEKLIQRSDAYLKEQEREAIHNLFSQSVNTFVSLIISWVILLLGVYFVAGGQLDGIFLAMLVMISLTVFEHAAPMAAFPSYLEDSRQAAARLSDATHQDSSVKSLMRKK